MSAQPQTTATPPATLAHRPCHGVWSPAITPLDAELAIDGARYVRHARRLLDEGCHGIAVFGTTGEANSFSVDERMRLLDTLLEAGLEPERLMVGNGTCALTDTVRLTAHAAAAGCHKVLMLPPFYYKDMSDRGLFESYKAVIERVADDALQIYLYHFPRLSGVPITPGLIELLLAACPRNVVGIKDSSGDWENTAMLLQRFPSLSVFPGNERMMVPALRAGAVGCITAGANCNAGPLRAAFDAWAADAPDADARQQAVTAVREAIDRHPMVPGLKYVAARQYGEDTWRRVRPPMLALDDAAGADLEAGIRAAGA